MWFDFRKFHISLNSSSPRKMFFKIVQFRNIVLHSKDVKSIPCTYNLPSQWSLNTFKCPGSLLNKHSSIRRFQVGQLEFWASIKDNAGE